MKHTETYIVDLNDFYEGTYLTISRRHTREYGRGVLVDPINGVGIQEGDHVTVYSDDERTSYDARVVKSLKNDLYAVEVFWDSGVYVSQPASLFGGSLFKGASQNEATSV